MKKQQAIILYQQLNRLMAICSDHYDATLQHPDTIKINPLEQQVLGLLEWQASVGIKDVVSKLDLPNSTVTSAVSRLIDKGLILKEVDERDRRAYMLKLTRKGNDMVAYRRYLKQRFAEDILEGFETGGEGQKLIELLTKAVMSLDKIHDDPTRSGFMNSLQQEYHSFGPWLIEIKSEEDIPQQYISHTDKILAADYCFKVPVKEDRHRLRPGMLMYNTVVCIYEDRLLIIKASQDSMSDFEITFESIRYICSSRELLDSHFIFATDQKIFDIDYNSVSSEISEAVMGYLRTRIFKEEGNVESSIRYPQSDVPEEVYSTMTLMFRHEKDLVLLGYQPQIRVFRHYNSTAEAFFNLNRRYDLQDVLFLANDRELICIDSIHEVKTSVDPDYSYRFTFLKIPKITRVEFLEEPQIDGVQSLVIHSGEASVSFKVGEEFDSTYLKRYLKLDL